MAGALISNDRQARETAAQIGELDEALGSERLLDALTGGLPQEAITAYRRSLADAREHLTAKLRAFQKAKAGDLSQLREDAGSDLGSQLIVARISRGYTHKQLARKLGMREQAIQRYEAERYRSISLSGFQRVAAVLDLKFAAEQSRRFGNEWGLPFEVDHALALKVLKHAKSARWFDSPDDGPESGVEDLKRTIGEHLLKYGKPSLLRTGLGVHHVSQDLAVVAWKAQVARQAEKRLKDLKSKFRLTDVRWLSSLARMSIDEHKLVSVTDFLAERGIVLIYEKAVPGTNIDGASFLIEDTPVVGLTLRHDAIDNFWFTLFHELAHVVLHYWTGLQSGFFDDLDVGSLENVEQEANNFAGSCLIPNELWIKSPARIAKTPEPLQNFAKHLGIHQAIVFGRVRKERDNYTLFSDRIGRGKVRKALLRE